MMQMVFIRRAHFKILLLALCAALFGCGRSAPAETGVPAAPDAQQDVIQKWTVPSESAGAEDNAQSPEPAAPDPRIAQMKPVSLPPDALRLSMRHPLTMNPLLNRDVTVDRALKFVFEPLFILDGADKPVPNLVSDYSLSADGLSVSVTLRDGLAWEDGEPVTTDDLAYSIDVLKHAPPDAMYRDSAAAIDGCAPVDARNAIIRFTAASWYNLYELAFPVIPRHYYSASGYSTVTSIPPLGDGQYKFGKFDGAKGIDFAAAGNYKGEPSIGSVQFLITPDHETDCDAFAQGLTDALPTTLNEWAKYSGVQNVSVTEYASQNYDFIGFNYTRALFQNPNARRALACAVDLNDAVNSVYLGHAVRAYSPINPTSWLFVQDNGPPEYDLGAAKTLFAQSGLDFSGAKARLKTGEAEQDVRLVILVNSDNNERAKLAAILKDGLAKLAIDAAVESVPFDEYKRRVAALDYDIFIGGFNLSAVPDLTFAFGSVNRSNIFGYSDAAMNACLARMTGATSESAFKAAAGDLQRYFYDTVPVVSVAFRNNALLTNPRVTAAAKPTLFYEFSDIAQMKLG